MSTTYTLKGTVLTEVNTDGTRAAPTLITDGLSVQDLSAVAVVVSADLTRTLSGTGTVDCYVYIPKVCDTAATGTITLATSSGAITATVGGYEVGLTWATTDDATAAALAVLLNAHVNIRALVHAVAVAGVITLTSTSPGPVGNAVSLAVTGTNVSRSAATLTGGIRWVRAPAFDLSVTASAVRDQSFPAFELLVPRDARVCFKATTVGLSAGGVTVHTIGQSALGAH